MFCIWCLIGTNSGSKNVEVGHSDDTGGEEDNFEPRKSNLGVFGSLSNGAVRQSGTFRGASQTDPSRSSSLISETSSQSESHPFYKVSYIIRDYNIFDRYLYNTNFYTFSVYFSRTIKESFAYVYLNRKRPGVTSFCTITLLKMKMILRLSEVNVWLCLIVMMLIGFGYPDLTVVMGSYHPDLSILLMPFKDNVSFLADCKSNSINLLLSFY